MSDLLAFIGGGNMARAIVGGLLQAGHDPSALRIADPSAAQRDAMRALGAVQTFEDNADAVRGADVVVLAVKPQYVAPVCREIAQAVREADALIVSVAAGVPAAAMSTWLAGHARIVRVMPNTPALVGRGAAGAYATAAVDAADRARVAAMLDAVGLHEWVEDEDALHAVTAISGSGPAYFFLFMECLEREALALGLSADAAARLTRQTAAGAAAMAADPGVSLAELRHNVTSPGGTTQAAIEAFRIAGLEAAIARAVDAARRRSIELARFDEDD